MSPLELLQERATGLRAPRVRFDVDPLPAWLASAARTLEGEGVIEAWGREPVPAVANEPGARGLDRLSVALDAWLARRILHAPEQAWRPALEGLRAARGRPSIVLGVDAPPAADGDAQRWWLRFGASGTRHAEELARGDAVLEIELLERLADGRDVVVARTRTKAARSLFVSQSRAGWKAAALLERVLRARAARPPSGSPSRNAHTKHSPRARRPRTRPSRPFRPSRAERPPAPHAARWAARGRCSRARTRGASRGGASPTAPRRRSPSAGRG
ncbi:MAG: hypothetical protein IPJ77_03550 [Planctomycetes bacterium]|nr:hypothetical protein [Planctomycetota bacterium]